jgi:molecular chaperone HtpG
LFTEVRFNSWVVGELHVLDDRILPNGRRDHFEQNTHFNNLLGQLRPITQDLSRRCRQSSIRRNVLRQFIILSDQVAHNLSVISQGAISQVDRKRLGRDTIKVLERIEKLGAHLILEAGDKQRILRALHRYQRRLGNIDDSNQHKALAAMNRTEKAIITRVCSLIYEHSGSKSAAKQLIDRLLARL